MKRNLLNGVSAFGLGIASLTLSGLTTVAADSNWSGGSSASGNWSDAANWDSRPANGDNLNFNTAAQLVNTDDLLSSIGWLQFGAGNFTVNGTNALTVGSGITNTVGDNTLALPLVPGSSQTWSVAPGSSLTFSGGLNLGANALTLGGDGNATLNTTAATGTGSLTKNGAGTLTLSVASSYSGGTVVNGGNLVSTAGGWYGARGIGTGLLTINSGAVAEFQGAHVFGVDVGGRAVAINNGTLRVNAENYVSAVTMAGGTIDGGGELRNGNPTTFTILPGTGPAIIQNNFTVSYNGADAIFNVSNNAQLTIYGSISGGAAGIQKNGPGILEFDAATSYSKPTVVNAGTLKLGAGGTLDNTSVRLGTNAVLDLSSTYFSIAPTQSISGVGTIVGSLNDGNPGASLLPGGALAAGTMTIDTLSLGGNLTLNFDLANVTTVGGGVNDLLVVTNLTLSSWMTNVVNFSFLGGTPALGTYTLIKYTTGPAAGPVTTLAAAASRYIYSFSSDGASIKVTVTGSPASLVWKGDGLTNAWDTAISLNWLNGAVQDFFLQGDNAIFSDTGSASPAVNISGAVQPTTVTVNATKNYTFAGSGKISDGAKLLKSNTGTLTLLNDNDFNGGGSLAGGPVYVGAVPVDSQVGGATGNLGTGNLTNNTTVVFSKTSTTTYGGNMSGAGNMIKLGSGQLNLSGTNTFTGGLVISNGTVKVGADTPVTGARFNSPITNYSTLFFSVADPFTLAANVTGAGNPNQFGAGDISIVGNGGMTVDGTASLATGPFGNLNVSQNGFGKLTVAPGGVVNVGAFLLLGNPSGISGSVVQTGGTVNVTNLVRVGHWGSEISTYTMSGGTLNVPNAQLAVGWDGVGLFNLSGTGTINCRTLNVDDNGNTSAIGGTNSTFTMSGGTVNIGPGGMGGNTATFLLGGGTIAAPAFSWSSSKAMILTNSGPTFDTATNTITLSGVLSGNGGLTKQGNGVLQLDGVNTYTNVTTITAGRLQGGGTISGPLVVNSGAILSAGGTLARGTLTVSNNVTVNPGASLLFDQASTALSSDLLRVFGNLALDPAGTPIAVNFTGGLPYTGGANVILTNSGVRTGTLTYSNPTRYLATLDQSNPNYVTLSFSGTNAGLVWKGNVNNLWDVNSTANWLNGGAADKFYQSDAVLFDGSGLSTPNVTLAADVAPASVNVNAAGDYTLAGGAIAGVGSLTKNGAGTLTLANNNTYTGGTYVNAGVLQLGNGGTSGSVAGNIYNQSTVSFNRADNSLYGGVMSGPGQLIAAGTGKLTLTADQAHTGGSTVNPGATVQLGLGTQVDAGSLGNTTVTNNGSVIFYRNATANVAAAYTGPGSLLFQGTGLSGQGAFQMNATNTFTGPVTLSLARLQTGVGAYGFGNPSSITIQQGSQAYATVPGTSGIYTNAGYRVYNLPLTLVGTGWRENAGQLGALRLNTGAIWAGPITLAGNTRITAYNDGNDNRITGTISGGSAELEIGTSGSGSALLTLSPSTPNSFGSLRLSAGTLAADNANALPSGIPLVMNGGTLRLNGVNFTTPNYMSAATGTIQNSSTNSPAYFTFTTDPLLGAMTFGAMGETGTQPLHVTWNGRGATLTFGSASGTWTGNLTNNGGAIITSGGNTYFGNNNAPNRYLVANDGGSFTWNINNVFGNGTANSYLPTIILNPGCSVFNNNYNIIGPVVLNGATLAGSRNSTGYRRYQFRGSVTVTGSAPSYILGTGYGSGDHLDTATVFNVADVTGNANPDLIVTDPLANRSGDYGGNGGLVKTGAGTLELDGINLYTGSTVISNGTLALGVAGSLASATITVASGARFDASASGSGLMLGAQTVGGSGTVVGNVLDGANSVLQPGGNGTAGTLTIGGNLTLGGAGSLKVDLANTTTVGANVNDLLQVNGDLSLNDYAPTPVNFTFLNGKPATSGSYVVLKYTGNLSGSAAGLTNTQGYAVAFTVNSSTREVRATFAVAPAQNLVWQGDGSANAWDLTTSSLAWFNGAVSTNFYQFDTVRFDDSLTTLNTTVNLNDAVAPTAITMDSTNNYVITGSGRITGSTGLTKNNTNTLSLGTANDFTGPLALNAGVLKLANASAIPRGAVITVATNAQFDFAGQGNDNTCGYTFIVGGSGPDGSGALTNSGGAVYSYANVSNLVLTADTVVGGSARWDIGPMANSALNGNGHTLTKIGSFDLDMRPQLLTNLASIVVSNGLLFYEAYDQTNSWTTSTTNYVRPGASVGSIGRQINLPIELDNATIRNSGGTPFWLGPISVASSSVFNNSGAQNFYGPISGPGAVLVSGGTSALTLTNANTYAGGTIVSNAPSTTGSGTAGTAALLVANPAALGSGPLKLDLGVVTLNTLTNILRPVEFNVTSAQVIANDIILPGNLITNVALQGRDNTSVFTLAGKLTGGHVGLTNWLDFGNSGSLGVMRLSNPANDFVAKVINVNRGVLAITADSVLGNSANVLRLDQSTAASGLRFDAPAINVAHNLLLNSASAFDLFGDNNGDGLQDTVNNVTLSGTLSGGGAVSLRGTNGVLTLTANNSYSGGFEMLQPVTVQVVASANLGTAYMTLKAGGTFRYTGTGSETMTRTLYCDGTSGGGFIDIQNVGASLTWNPGGGGISQPLTKLGPGAFTLGSLGITGGRLSVNAGTMTVNSVISGNTAVAVNGGTLVLNGANTLAYPIAASGGTLLVNGSTPATSPVTIGLGGALGGNGTLNGPVAINAGAALQPGVNAIGKLTINNVLTLSGTTTMKVNKAANTNDAVVGLTSVSYGGTLVVNNLGSQSDLTAGTRFVLFSAIMHWGNFAAFTLPPLDSGLQWDTSMLAVDGSIQVVAGGLPTTPTNIGCSVSSGSLNLSWPTNYTGWILLEQTNNFSLGVSTNHADWSPVAGAEATNQVSIPLDKTRRDSFYRLVRPPYNP